MKHNTKLRMVMAVSQANTMATLNKGQISFYREHGFDVKVYAAEDSGVSSIIEEGGEFFDVGFCRSLTPLRDLVVLVHLIWLFAKHKPDVVQLMTLKPCFLGAIAAKVTKVPVIIRYKWGNMRDSNYTGFKRRLLLWADKVSNSMADRVVAICHKLKEIEVQHGAVDPSKIFVYGAGSDNGVDLNRFNRTDQLILQGEKIRQQLGIKPGDMVLGTVMRINIEKGICELIEAFVNLSRRYNNLHLIIVGDYDIRNKPPEEIVKTIREHPRIHHVGFQPQVENYYAAMNIFVMPSYREGFCKSNIEASSMQLPVVATNVIGCNESVKDGVSGLLVPPRNSAELEKTIERLLTDKQLAERLGLQGRKRVENEFDNYLVWHYQLRGVCEMLKSKGLPPPVEPVAIEGSVCPVCKKLEKG